MGLLNKIFGTTKEKKHQSIQPQGFYIVKYDYGEQQARNLFAKADAGDVNAQLIIAKCFVDAGERLYALPWYEKAAEAGSSKALHELTYYYEGRYVDVAPDPVKAEAVRKRALNSNNPQAFLKLGSQYYSGDGVEKNWEKAFECYMKAAQLGNDEAKAQVGLCYMRGEGVKQNNEQAFAWLSRSNDRFYGYYYLAQCYIGGIGTPKNLEKGVVILEKAVSNKCLDLYKARTQLKALYEKGYGGTDRNIKLRRLCAEIGESDRLINELANINL